MYCYDSGDCQQKKSEVPGSNFPFCKLADFTSHCKCCEHHHHFKEGRLPAGCEWPCVDEEAPGVKPTNELCGLVNLRREESFLLNCENSALSQRAQSLLMQTIGARGTSCLNPYVLPESPELGQYDVALYDVRSDSEWESWEKTLAAWTTASADMTRANSQGRWRNVPSFDVVGQNYKNSLFNVGTMSLACAEAEVQDCKVRLCLSTPAVSSTALAGPLAVSETVDPLVFS